MNFVKQQSRKSLRPAVSATVGPSSQNHFESPLPLLDKSGNQLRAVLQVGVYRYYGIAASRIDPRS